MRKLIFLVQTLGLALIFCLPAKAHTFYEGMVDISINPNNGHLEVVHQYTTHDLSTMLTELNQKSINPDSPEFERALKAYMNKHYRLKREKDLIPLTWVGVDAGVAVTKIYQELTDQKLLQALKGMLKGIEVNCSVLTHFYPRQINRVNYQDAKQKGTLIFNQQTDIQAIP